MVHMLQPIYVVEGLPDILIVCSVWQVDQNDNKTILKAITSGVKNGPCETLPTFDDVHLVLRIPYMLFCVGKSQLCRYKIFKKKTDVKLVVGS